MKYRMKTDIFVRSFFKISRRTGNSGLRVSCDLRDGLILLLLPEILMVSKVSECRVAITTTERSPPKRC